MAQLPQAANTEENAGQGGLEAIPEDEYVACLTKSEWTDTKAGTGKFIYMEFTIMEGAYKGNILIERLNMINPNPIAVRIATGALNQLSAACLKANVEDTDELHGIPVLLTVVIEEQENSDYPPSNRIKRYSNPDGETFQAPWDK